jgi:hypothetical protein
MPPLHTHCKVHTGRDGAEMLLAVAGRAVADDVFHQRTVVGQQLPADLFTSWHSSAHAASSAISFSISLTVPLIRTVPMR